MNKSVYLALVHHPIVNKQREIVTTSVTNLDIHDIARSCRTFGIKNYYIVTPIVAQKELVGRILGYWKSEKSHDYNPDRFEALAYIKIKDSIDLVMSDIEEQCGERPHLIVTTARKQAHAVKINELYSKIGPDNRPLLVLFGTGYGLAEEVLERADFCLTPIEGLAQDGYNHLSVRSAVAIYCDRLMGKS